jgi:hypothetical protein
MMAIVPLGLARPNYGQPLFFNALSRGAFCRQQQGATWAAVPNVIEGNSCLSERDPYSDRQVKSILF